MLETIAFLIAGDRQIVGVSQSLLSVGTSATGGHPDHRRISGRFSRTTRSD